MAHPFSIGKNKRAFVPPPALEGHAAHSSARGCCLGADGRERDAAALNLMAASSLVYHKRRMHFSADWRDDECFANRLKGPAFTCLGTLDDASNALDSLLKRARDEGMHNGRRGHALRG